MVRPGLGPLNLLRVAAIVFWTGLLGVTFRDLSVEAASTIFDPEFGPGFAVLSNSIGTSLPDGPTIDWQPGLRLLIGVKAVDGAKRTTCFVELTTLAGSVTNSADTNRDQTWRTNRISWSGADNASGTNLVFDFTYRFAPVKVRVFDGKGHALGQGQTLVAWELMTNSLAEVCRLCLAWQNVQALPPEPQERRNRAIREFLGADKGETADWARIMRPIAGGILTVGGLFSECAATPVLNDICDKAQRVVRLPGTWALLSAALGAKMDLSIDPRFLTDVRVVDPRISGQRGPWYRFPADLKNGRRTLASVEFIVGPSSGAEVMVAGIRSIHAVHPSKPNREFLAQVLASGMAKDDLSGGAPARK